MYKKIVCTASLVTAILLAQDPPQSTNTHQQAPVVNNYITVNPVITTNAQSTPQTNIATSSNQDSTVASSAQAHTRVETNNRAESHATSLNFNYNYFPNFGAWGDAISDFCKQNKKRFFLGTVAITYGTIFYHVAQGNVYLRSKSRWSAWHKEIPLKNLREINHEQLMAEMLYSTQKRYISITDPINFSAPLSTFMQELAQEEKTLLFYQKLYNWCSRLWIRKLFPFNVKLYKKIGIYLRRVRFLRHRFMQWIIKYKIEHNQAFAKAMRSLQI